MTSPQVKFVVKPLTLMIYVSWSLRRSSENYQRHWEINTASDSFCLTDREFGADSRFFFFYPNTSRVREPSSPSKVALQRAVFWVFWCPSNLLRSFYIYNCTMFQRLFLIVVLAIAAISATEVCCCVFSTRILPVYFTRSSPSLLSNFTGFWSRSQSFQIGRTIYLHQFIRLSYQCQKAKDQEK